MFTLRQSVHAAKEVYEFAKHDNDPSISLNLLLEKFKHSCLYQLSLQKWKMVRIFGGEKPISPRAYIAINLSNILNPKVIIVYVGAVTLPYPLESWWTNDTAEQQSEIWSKVNFNRSKNEHTGIKSYAEHMIKKIKCVLTSSIPQSAFKNTDFELIGHSTGGVLAIATALDLRRLSLGNKIHVLGYGTPNFLTIDECKELRRLFPNNGNYSIFNLIALNDPALGIYGENLIQPEENTIFLVPPNFTGSHFINIHAASQGTTKAHIKFHFPEHYEILIENICQSCFAKNDKALMRAKL